MYLHASMLRSRLASIALNLSLGCLVPTLGSAASASGDYWMYVGAYTTTAQAHDSKGIYLYKFHSLSGKVEPMGLAAARLPQAFARIRAAWPFSATFLRGVQNPSFIAIHPNGQYIYSADENNVGTVSAFRIDPVTGTLTQLNVKPSAGGLATFVAVDHTGRNLLVANYDGGKIAVLPIERDGRLGDATSVMEHQGSGPDQSIAPRTHSINLSLDNRFAIATDTALDRILIYRFDANRSVLSPNDPPFVTTPLGTAPRHFTFHPNGTFGYAVGERGSSLVVLKWDAQRGRLSTVQSVSTLPRDFHGWSAGADVLLGAEGKFLYASNRGHDSIAVFTVDQRTGTLIPIQYQPTQGQSPRSIVIDPTGRYLFAVNARTGSIVQFQIDRQTGRLTPAGCSFKLPAPASISFAPAS